MTSRLKLEVFETGPAPGPGTVVPHGDLEDLRAEAFETGYKAGWDDAQAAQQGEAAKLREDIGRNLQDLAFTYHDARGHVLRSLAPLFAEITARLLPEIARASLPHVVAEALGPYAEIVSEAPIHVQVHPETRPILEPMLDQTFGLPLHLRDDPQLPPGRVQLSLGTTETRVDLDAALSAIRTAIDDFFELNAKETRHG
jgi:flagellar biosynthesis/type III secretory pathway protein FliH